MKNELFNLIFLSYGVLSINCRLGASRDNDKVYLTFWLLSFVCCRFGQATRLFLNLTKFLCLAARVVYLSLAHLVDFRVNALFANCFFYRVVIKTLFSIHSSMGISQFDLPSNSNILRVDESQPQPPPWYASHVST